MSRWVLVAWACALSACATRFESVRLEPATLEPKGGKVAGVIVYEPRLVCLTWHFTARKEGEEIKEYQPSCEPIVQKQEIQLMPDLRKPLAIVHKPSMFASGSLSVTIANGMLASLNAENTPLTAEILEQLVAAAQAAPSIAGLVPTGARKACNAAPQLTTIEDATAKSGCSPVGPKPSGDRTP